jgi:glycerol-3-phosphate dehydrogenase
MADYDLAIIGGGLNGVSMARDAAGRGLRVILLEQGDLGAGWRLVAIDRGHRRVIAARALANASGSWTATVAETVLRLPPPDLGVSQISQIVVRRLFDTDHVWRRSWRHPLEPPPIRR